MTASLFADAEPYAMRDAKMLGRILAETILALAWTLSALLKADDFIGDSLVRFALERGIDVGLASTVGVPRAG